MNYTIDIIDTLDDSHTLVLRYAEKSSVQLSWEGGDERASQNIVGSSLTFRMEVSIGEMAYAAYADLFTGDENRYQVRLYATDTDVTVWQGFLLPDSYREPVDHGTIYIEFTATDGLARLKGKYLADVRYREEFPVTTFLSDCLRETGVPISMCIAPAIFNLGIQRYDEIFLYGADFLDNGKPMDCYTILEKILSSMLCELYQADDVWYIEGFNRKHKKTVAFDQYDLLGQFVSKVDIVKLTKAFNGLDIPMITAVPPASKAVIIEKRVPIMLPEEIAQEKNDGWSIGEGVDGQIFPTHWVGNGGYLPESPAPDYNVALRTSDVLEFDNLKYISLRKKLYVSRFQKMVFRGKFAAEVDPTKDGTTPNGLRLEFLLNGRVIRKIVRSFTDKELDIKFDLYPSENGNLDLRIYRPYFGGTIVNKTYSRFINIEELSLETIKFNENAITEVVVNDGFTVAKELELYLSDDPSGFTKGFRLQKLNEKSEDFNAIDFPVLHTFEQNDTNYAQVSLFGANLASDNIDSIYKIGQIQLQPEVTYNYQEGEQMVISTAQPNTDGSFTVRRHRVADGPQDRDEWQRWSDAEYPVGRTNYAKTAAEVLSRIFSNASERIDYLFDGAVKYNDIIEFDYVLHRTYFPTRVTWNVDEGTTEITMHRCQYENDSAAVGTGNIPPIVSAGADVILPGSFSVISPPGLSSTVMYTHKTAYAFDPDGFIASHQWTVTGGQVVQLINGKDFEVSFFKFSGNSPLTLTLSVTDSEGATASDSVTFRKQSEYAVVMVNTTDDDLFDYRGNNDFDYSRFRFFDYTMNPNLLPNEAVTVRGSFYQKLTARDKYSFDIWRLTNNVAIFKNGVKVMQSTLLEQGDKRGDFEFNYIKGDEVSFQISLVTNLNMPFLLSPLKAWKMIGSFEVNEVIFQQGGGSISGYPVTVDAEYEPYV